MKLISIIVPCYNQAHFLDECLTSILEQTYSNWECIIINDGSSDHTEDIAKKWLDKDTRFKYVYKENGGLSSARNTGLNIAKGDYIQLLDSDDLLEKDKLNFQVQALLADNEIDISVSGYRYFEHNSLNRLLMGTNNILPEVALMKNDLNIIELLKLKNPMVISAPLYRKRVFEAVGLFDELLTSLEDWDFHTRCAIYNLKFQHIGFLKDTFTLIRLHSQSMMKDNLSMNSAYLQFKEKRETNPIYKNFFSTSPIKKKSNIQKIFIFIKLFIPPIIIKVFKPLKKMFNG